MPIRSPKRQQGVLLLEALIGILIFSIGILALVAMHATAVSQMSDAKYRADAAYLADRLIGDIWANRNSNTPTLTTNWINEISASNPPLLPNATGANAPTVAVAGNQVTVTVYWQAPGASTRSNHVAIAYLDFN